MKKFLRTLLVITFIFATLVCSISILSTNNTNKVEAATTTYTYSLALSGPRVIFASGSKTPDPDYLPEYHWNNWSQDNYVQMTYVGYNSGLYKHIFTVETEHQITSESFFKVWYYDNVSYFTYRRATVSMNVLPTEDNMIAMVDDENETAHGRETTCTWQSSATSIEGAVIGDIDCTYTGSLCTPQPTVTLDSTELILNTDYYIDYTNNIWAGVDTATIKITGKGNYTGVITKTFTIKPASLEGCTIADIEDQAFTGKEIQPKLTVTLGEKTISSSDYTCEYSNNIVSADGKTASVTITGKDNYTGSATAYFHISTVDLRDGKGSIDAIADQTYNAGAVEPTLKVKYNGVVLTKDRDYTVTFKNNTTVGVATVEVTGMGSCTGSLTQTFNIVEMNLSDCTVAEINDCSYTGSAITPEITITVGDNTLVKDTDYTVEFSNNIEIGKATVTINGKGHFKGTVTKNFNITKINMNDCTISEIAELIYTGEALTPDFTVSYLGTTLIKDTDYSVTYSDNTNEGNATITITSMGNYIGTATKTFVIKKIDVAECQIADIADLIYTTEAQTPDVVITYGDRVLVKDTDFTVSYENNIEEGTASISIAGIGVCKGETTKSFVIKKIDVAECQIASIEDMKVTEEALTPEVAISYGDRVLVKDVDFTVSYENNIEVGTATITITGIGVCKGSTTTSFNIVKNNVAGTVVAIATPVTVVGGGAAYVYFGLMKAKGMAFSQVVSTGKSAVVSAGKTVGTVAKNVASKGVELGKQALSKGKELGKKAVDAVKNLLSKFKK